jgi:hypothetical protein
MTPEQQAAAIAMFNPDESWMPPPIEREPTDLDMSEHISALMGLVDAMRRSDDIQTNRDADTIEKHVRAMQWLEEERNATA